MNTSQSVIVYAGPSVSSRLVQTLLPGCTLRPPIRRGDLYRDREQGGALFVLLDGVLIQEPALPLREIMDVLQDGATIIGASSMGALRAAECWPAGMQGVGTIYRLFRRGSLHSDDEVILTFAAEDDYRPLSVALINIRYALRRAVQNQRLDAGQAAQIIEYAETLHFSARRWPTLLAHVGIQDSALQTFLSNQDLKHLDAVRALRRVAHGLARSAYTLAPRCSQHAFVPSEAQREQTYAVTAGLESAASNSVALKQGVARWHLISGRYTRHIAAIAAASPSTELAERLARKRELDVILDGLAFTREQVGEAAATRLARQQSVALRWVLLELWQTAATVEFAECLWAELQTSGELSAELFRWRAITAGAREAHQRGLQVRRADVFLAEAEIAHAHGFHSWRMLRQNSDSAPYPWADFEHYRNQLALAKRLREALFNPVAYSSCGSINP
ncbi:MAG: TfuA-like protein [Gammaproteobacteria bacterium]